MAENSSEVRERVRKLVQEVLASVPDADPTSAEQTSYPERLVVNSLRNKAEREYDRDESSKLLITEDDIRGLSQGDRLRVDEKAKFTPLAQDLVNSLGLQLITKTRRESSIRVRSIAIGSDHGGFDAKEQLKIFLSDHDVKIRDFGTDSKEAVDYPDFAHAVASSVGAGHVDAG
nr:RpiB/LacA/LacB family sugar-phosphate isomerase [Blastocatellia bacterium]